MEKIEHKIHKDFEELINRFSIEDGRDIDIVLNTLCSKRYNLRISPKKCCFCHSDKEKEEITKVNSIKFPCKCSKCIHKSCIISEVSRQADDLFSNDANIVCDKCKTNVSLLKLIDMIKELSNEALKKLLQQYICPICSIIIQEKSCFNCKCSQKYHHLCLKSLIHNLLTTSLKDISEKASNLFEINCLNCKNCFDYSKLTKIFTKNELSEIQESFTRQTINNLKNSNPAADKKLACGICLEDKNVDKQFITLECDHKFCKDCLENYIKAEIQKGEYIHKQNKNITCPNSDCNMDIDFQIINDVISDKNLSNKYESLIMQKELGKKNKDSSEKMIRCPNGDCQFFCFIDMKTTSFVICPTCNHEFCVNGCKKVHRGFTCEQMKKIEERENEENRIIHFKNCPNCKIPIQKTAGCNHITCSCGTGFCYICGSTEWKECGHQYVGVALAERCIFF